MVAHSPRPFALSVIFFLKSRSMPQIDELDWLQWYSVDITFSPSLSSSINFLFIFFSCCLCKPFFYAICLIFKIRCNNEFDTVEWYHKTFFVLLLSSREWRFERKQDKKNWGNNSYRPQGIQTTVFFTFSQRFTSVSIMQSDRNTEEVLKFLFKKTRKRK